MFIKRYLEGYRRNKFLVKNMVLRDIKQRYSGSILGILWIFIQPLSTVIIYTFVFSLILKVKLGPEFAGVNFTLWLLAGMIPWLFINETTNRSVNAILENANLIKKTLVDSKWIIVSYILTGLFNFSLFLIVFFLLLLFFNVSIGDNFYFLIYYIVILSLFVTGLSWVISALNVFIRDIGQILGVLLNVWFYLTPIIYPINLIPDKYKMWIEMNPLFHIVEGFRVTMLSTKSLNFSSIIYATLFSVLSFYFGKRIFKKLQDGFVDVL